MTLENIYCKKTFFHVSQGVLDMPIRRIVALLQDASVQYIFIWSGAWLSGVVGTSGCHTDCGFWSISLLDGV